MNYFQLLQIPVSFQPDKDEVRKKYLEITQQHAPDDNVNNKVKRPKNPQETAVLLNNALYTLSHRDETIKYVLHLKGLWQEVPYRFPASFLMQVEEINKAMAAGTDLDPNKKIRLGQQVLELEKEIYEPVKNIMENYQEGVTSEEALLQVKDYYFKKKYLEHLYQQLNGML